MDDLNLETLNTLLGYSLLCNLALLAIILITPSAKPEGKDKDPYDF